MISKKSSGFTLIELLVTISILTIVAAATFGSMNLFGYRAQQSLNLEAQGIVVVLRNAQNRSISQENGLGWGVHFDNTSTSTPFYELFSGASYPGTSASKTVINSGLQFITPPDGSSSTIIFATATGKPIYPLTVDISLLNNTAVSSTIVINSNGEIQY